MRDKKTLKEIACHAIDNEREKICEFGDLLKTVPEFGFREEKTSKLIKEFFESLNIPCRDKIALTGIIGNIKGKSDKNNVAILAEMDAVYSPNNPLADITTGAAHACGHNAMMASLAGVAIAFSKTDIMEDLNGMISLMAIPAEEFIEIEFRRRLIKEGLIHFCSGKQEFIYLGEFDSVDVALMQHILPVTSGYKMGAVSECTGFQSKIVHYIGKTAHAGVAPDEGINALNAAVLGMMAINAQRETFRDEDRVRVHPIMTKGGDAVSCVPDDVWMEMYVRATNREAITNASSKVDRALQSGAYAVGAKCEIENIPGYLPLKNSDQLAQYMFENLELLGGEGARKECSGFGGGSIDLGDVSHILPCLLSYFSAAEGNLHSSEFKLIDIENAYINSAKALAMTIIDLLADDSKGLKKVKANFIPEYSKEEYLKQWLGQ